MMNSTAQSLVWKPLPDLADKEGFAGSYAGVSRGVLLVVGGANFPDKPMWEGGKKTWTDRIFVLETPESAWRECGCLPHPYAYGASVSLPEGLVCVGGCDAQGHRRDVYVLSYESGSVSCRSLADLPRPLANMGAAVLGDRIYVMGGSEFPGEQDALSSLYSLEWKKEGASWVEESPIPGAGRFLFQTAVGRDCFYVLGGIALKPGKEGRMDRDLLREAWSWSPESGWVRLPDLPRFCAAAPTPVEVSPSGRIFLLGGDDGTRAGFTPVQEHPGFHSASLSYDTLTSEWSECGPVPAARAVLPCCVWYGMSVIVNGEQRPGKRSNQVWGVTLP